MLVSKSNILLVANANIQFLIRATASLSVWEIFYNKIRKILLNLKLLIDYWLIYFYINKVKYVYAHFSQQPTFQVTWLWCWGLPDILQQYEFSCSGWVPMDYCSSHFEHIAVTVKPNNSIIVLSILGFWAHNFKIH